MFSVCLLVVVFDSPHSAVFGTIPNGIIRLVILASASGLIATLLIQSPWGKRSGAHLNPAVTIAFLRLRRVQPWDALFYILAHLLGACTGVLCILLIAGSTFSEPPVLCAITVPGSAGAFLAFLAETGISMLLMALILFFIRSPRRAPFTGMAIGILIATFIAVESPVSGTSMNPARTLASALPSHIWNHIWVYLCGPVLGMLIAAEIERRCSPVIERRSAFNCAKLLHSNNVRCIHCGFVPNTD